MSKKITLENVDSSELPEIPVIGEVKQIRFTQDMELVSTLADSDLFMVQAGADLEARPNTITFDLIIKNLSGPIEEGSKKFVTGDMMFKVIGDMNLLNTWDNTNLVSSLNATYVNVRRIEEELRREINRSTGKDEQHDEQIANLRQDLTATNELLNQEINRSVAKDNEHDDLLAGLRDDVDSTSDKLDAEIDRSTAKDAEHDTLLKGLRVDVNANKSAIDSEVARSTARDEAHDEAIAQNASDITTEVNRAKAEEAKIRQEMQTADTNLQNAITAETERATGVEEDLQQQITDLSGSTDDRLEALEALSHEQNTDTGTTSKTFVIDSGNTGAMLKAEGGGLSTRTKGDAGYANFTVNNLVIKGDVTQEGDTFITRAERVEVHDNMILINDGETGAGVTAGFAGIEVDRGTEQNFMFGFNESDGMFKIGKEGNMFDVALRQPVGDMIDGMFASWDAATKTFKTTNVIPYNKSLDFKFDPEIVDATLKMKFMEAGLGLSMSGDDSILALLPGMPQDEVKYSLISTNTNGIILGDSSGSNDKFILDIKKPSFISPVLDKNVIIGGKNAYFSYYSHSVGSPNTIIASCGVKAPSFYRASDNAEVLYSLDQARLTDGMFLSWDATNKMLVANNLVPEGIKLYFGTSSNYIDYHNEGNGYIRFITNTGVLRFSTNNNFTTFRSSSNNGFQFIGKIETSNGVLNSLSDNLTIGTKQGHGSIKLYIGESSYITTPFSAVTFKRSSDDSEVLYQADLKSVLTGKETNYAPTVKAVSDAIDAVNTRTIESLKGYLKLSGGTMTGSIRIVDSGSSSTLQGIYNNDGTRTLLFTYLKGSESRWGVGTKETVGIIRSNVSDLIHLVNNNGTLNEYSIYDKRNLPDPATKSGNNSFTGTNSFVGGKFSVDGSESGVYVSKVGNLVSRSTYGNMGWIRSLEFSDNNVVVARFGVKATTTDNVPTTDFVGILVGDGTVNDSQYKFRTNKLTVPKSWSMIDGENDAITLTSNSSIFGRISTPLYLRGDNTDLFHTKNSTNYKVWDASNLPTPASTSDIPDVSDMAKRSEANTFTANNTFTAGQFNVGPFNVTATGSLLIDMINTGGWERSIMWSNNSAPASRIRFGSFGNADVAEFAWIGVGDVQYNTAQYRFYGTSMIVPSVWSLDDSDRNSLVWTQSTQLAHFGRATGTTKIRSGNVDLLHTKGTTDYKILDESNYSQYLPTSSKWTYGFVAISPGETKVDFNTVLSGPDSPKILLNYNHQLGSDTNAPSGMTYGTVLQIDGNYNSNYNNIALRPQLAFDINHNVENGTRYMWFRTANNLGYGDSSNWKRVVTADENVAAYHVDSSGYPSLKYINGDALYWLRSPIEGFLPNTRVSLASGGTSELGSGGWAFKNAYIANVYANKFITSGGSSSQFLKGDGSLDSTAYYPNAGRGYLSFDSGGRPVMSNNQGYCARDKGGVVREILWISTENKLILGNTSTNTALPDIVFRYGEGHTLAVSAIASKSQLDGYLPLTGGRLTGTLSINSGGSEPLIINNSASAGEAYVVPKTQGTTRGAMGWSASLGMFLQDSRGYTFSMKADGVYFGASSSTLTKLLTSADLSSYATQSWVTSQAYYKSGTSYPVFAGGVAIAANSSSWDRAYWAGNNDRNGATGVSFGGYGEADTPNYAYIGVGDNRVFNAVNNLKIYTDKVTFGNKTLATVDQIPTIPSISMTTSGSGNVVTGISASGHTITVTKGSASVSVSWNDITGKPSSFPPSNHTHDYLTVLDNRDVTMLPNNIGKSKFQAFFNANNMPDYKWWSGIWVNGWTDTYASWQLAGPSLRGTPPANGLYFRSGVDTKWNSWKRVAFADEIPTRTSDLTNDSGFLTSSSLSGYATQSWVTSQGYLTSITKSMVTTALGYTPPTTNTTYSQATSSTLGLVKIGATGLASKNYAVQLNSSGQMYVAVPWTDTNTTYSAATSSTYGLVKIGATGLAAKNYAVQLNSSGQMYVAVPWTDTDTNTHYTTRLYAGASGTAANSATTSPYIKVTDDDTYRNQIRLLGGGATSVSSDASGNITITSTNTTYGLATASSNGLMSSSQYTKLSNCIETVSATNMVTSVQVVDTIPATSSQVTGRLYLKFA